MADLFFNLPQQIIFGMDVVNRIGSLVSPFGKRVLIVTEAILYEQSVIERILDILSRKGIEAIVFDEVVPNATSACVDDGVKLARGSYAEAIIGLGGVRTLSTAKCIAMIVPGGPAMDDYLSGTLPQTEALPYIEIPTTCRNPFMLVDEYLMVDARDRTGKIGKTQEAITKAALVDPKLSFTLPAKYTLTTLLDVLLSGIEGLMSTKTNFLTETLFNRVVELAGAALKEPSQGIESSKSKLQASMAGLLAALGLAYGRAGIGAALSYAINARMMVPKSSVASILLPHILEFYAGAKAEQVALIGRLLGEENVGGPPGEAANNAIQAIRTRISSFGIPSRLRDFDLELDAMVDVAETAHSYDMINYLPRSVGAEDIYDIIKSAF
jgi:alcohol dehydrogenase